MNGLDKIIEKIGKEAEAEANRVIGEANAAARRVTDRAKEEAKKTEADAAERAELEYKRIVSRAESSGEITGKRLLLREKQQVITGILNEAHIKLVGLNDKEYFEFMTRLLKKYASGAAGELILSQKDKARAPASFKAAAKDMGLSISDKTRDMDGGFILSYGDIEENCSFSALMESERDRLHDAVNSYLFG